MVINNEKWNKLFREGGRGGAEKIHQE